MSSTSSGPTPLVELLSRVGAHIRRAVLIEAILGLLSVFAGALAIGAGLLLVGVELPGAGMIAAVGLIVGASGVVARGVQAWQASASAPTRVARHLDSVAERRGRRAAVRLLDAAELDRDRDRFGQSVPLTDAAVDDAVGAAERSGLEALARSELRGRLLNRGTWLFGLVVLDGILALMDPARFGQAARALTSPAGLRAALSPEVPEPRFGDFRIDYRYPEYAGRAPRTVISGTGEVRALPGTEVRLETRAREPLSRAVMVLVDGDGFPGTPPEPDPGSGPGDRAEPGAGRRRISVDVDGRRVRARFVVTRAGRYRFEVVDAEGREMAERRGHPIRLEGDQPPSVRLLSPEESPIEVGRRARVPVRFEAKDDFELGPARVAWRVLGTTREGKARLTDQTVGRQQYRGRARFDLGPLELKPGDRVAYSVEVLDNDTIGGPKVGASRTQEIEIYSKRSHHEKVMALQLEALDAVVHLLGDRLESPLVRPADRSEGPALFEAVEALKTEAQAAIEKLEAAATAAKKDPLGRENTDAAFASAASEIQRRIGKLVRAVATARGRAPVSREAFGPFARGEARLVGTLERHAVYLSDLMDDQRMLDAEALARELREQQLALRDALEAYRDDPSPENRERIAQAIQDIQKRIREIMEELAQLRKEIPQEFVNQDALQQRGEALEELARRVQEGDLEGAMDELDHLLNQTERMLSQLQEGREELMTREYSEITKQAEKLWQDLGEVKERQRDLADRTDGIADAIRERSKDRLDDADGFVKAQQERLEAARAALEPVRPERHMPDADQFEVVERRLEDAKQALEGRDFGATREVLEQALAQMEQLDREAERRAEQAERFGDVFGMGERAQQTREALAEAEPSIQKVMEAMDDLTPDPAELLEPAEKRQLDRFEDEQRALQKKANDLQQSLEALGEQLPLVGPEVRSALDDARSAMGQSADSLKAGDAPGAASQERRATEALDRLSKQLEEMGSQSGGGQGSAGVPLPFGQPRGTERESERGGSGRFNRDKVEIPRPEAYRAPSEFREDIVEAAKEGTVEAYRDAVRRYYEELVK